MNNLIKQNELTDTDIEQLDSQNMENIFNVYADGDGSYYYNLLKTVNFPEDLNPSVYDIYTAQPKDTWPLIAWKHYGNVKLWWIVCAVNQVDNPVGQPAQGAAIKILKPSVIRSVLSELKEL